MSKNRTRSSEPRSPAIAPVIASRLEGLCAPERVRFFDMPRIDISSTMVRARAAAGQPIRYLVPDKVANFIGAQSLYGSSAPVGAGA